MIQAWDRDFSAVADLIDVAQPQYITKQTAFEEFKDTQVLAQPPVALPSPVPEGSTRRPEAKAQAEEGQTGSQAESARSDRKP